MPNLYQLSNDLIILEAQILAEGGEMTDEERGLLDGLNMEFDEKGENIIKAIRNYEAEEEANKKEASFFSNRARVAANKVKALKKYLLENMQARQMDKHEFGKFKAAVQQSSVPSVEIVNSEAVPEDYIRVIREVDKKKATEHLKATGEEVPGLAFHFSHFLRIR